MSPQFTEQNSFLCLAQAAQSDMTASAGSALSCGGHGRQEGRAAQKEPRVPSYSFLQAEKLYRGLTWCSKLLRLAEISLLFTFFPKALEAMCPTWSQV